jgi:uncharacterized protein (DUF58 family)
MLPIPTRTALALAIGAAMALTVGALLASIAATLLGASLVLLLSGALMLTMPLGRRVRRERLEFAWWLAHGDPGAGGGAVVPRAAFEVRGFVRHRGEQPLLLTNLEPIIPGGAMLAAPESPEDEAMAMRVAAGSRTELSFRLVAQAAGRVVLHGLAVTLSGPLGLFEVPLYFPNPLVIKVLPQAAARVSRTARAQTGVTIERSGASLVASGGGTELKEIREMVPGDAFKQIAWKASARRGRLLVREVEQEVEETRYVVLDVSGTMRGGELGARKLDHAIEAIAAHARRALGAGDRVGLVTVDGRVLAHVPAGDGPQQLLRVFDALLGATEVVDEDLTDADEMDVIGVVGRYLRQQDGIDFVVNRAEWNVPLLLRHVQKALAAIDPVEASRDAKEPAVVASTPTSATLRRFCRVRGIPLPYRADPRDGAKAPGLAAALREIVARNKGPVSVGVITDLDGIGDPAPLVAAIKLLRMHGHTLTLFVPDAPSFAPPPVSAVEKTVFDVYARGEKRRTADVRTLLVPLGVRVHVMRASDSAATALAPLERGARRAA